MITEMISAILVLLIFSAEIMFIIMTLAESTHSALKEDIQACFYSFILAVLLGGFAGIPSFLSVVRDIRTEYAEPTYILRTNDMTHVVYINKKIYTESYTDAKYWNSTNILMKVNSGKNIWGVELKDKAYEIGIFNKESYEANTQKK